MGANEAAVLEPPQSDFDISSEFAGIGNPDWSNEQYHADRTAVSSSVLKQILRSPAHMKAYIEAPHEETTTRLIGTALHAAVLEPEMFSQQFIVWDGGDRRGKQWTTFVEDNKGKSILKESEMEDILGMRDSILEYSFYPIGELLLNGDNEKSIIWTDKETGVRCKIRPDNTNPYCMLDLKTTDDAREEAFARQVAKLRYDFQAAMYVDGYRETQGVVKDFYFVVVETEKPYGVYVHQASPEMLSAGYADYRKALGMYRKCQETGEYPGYEKPFSVIGLPRWASKGK